MCLKRDNDEKFKYPFPILDTIDLTLDELVDNDEVLEITSRLDHWNSYNLLPSSDEEESEIVFIDHIENTNGIYYADSNTTNDSSNEINQNANTSSASVNINLNISETNNTDQSNERREFELDIPQILLSMSRISNNLYNRTFPSHD